MNGRRIDYTLRIDADEMLRIEAILAAVSKIDQGFHEEIADRLQLELGGQQRLEAFHHGVHITTERP